MREKLNSLPKAVLVELIITITSRFPIINEQVSKIMSELND